MRLIRGRRLPGRAKSVLLFVGLASAGGVAIWAQMQLPDHAVRGGLAFGMAAVILLPMVVWAGPDEWTLPLVSEWSWPSRSNLLILGVSLPLCAIALVLFHRHDLPNVVIALWAASVAVALFAAWRLDRGAAPGNAVDPWTWLELALLVGIVILAAFLRAWRIWDLPGVFEDEAVHLNDAYSVQAGRISTPFVSATYSAGTIFEYCLAGLLYLPIDRIIALKLMGIIPGTMCCVFLYLFLRELFGRFVAIVGAALLAVSSWQIMYSRWGYVLTADAMLALAMLYLLARGLRTRRYLDFALCGVALGLGLVLFKSAAQEILLVPALGVFLILRYGRQTIPALGKQLVVLGVVAFLVFAPRALFIAEQPDKALARPHDVYLFNHETWGRFKDQPFLRIGRNIQELFLTFNYRAGYQGRLNTRPLKPQLDIVTGALVVLGFAYTLFRLKDPRYFLLLVLVAVMILPASTGLALDDRPVSYRIVGIAGALYAFGALPLGLLWRTQRARIGRAAVVLLTLGLVGGAAYLNYDAYFGQWGTNNYIFHGTGQVDTRIAKHIRSIPDRYEVYLATGLFFQGTVDTILRDDRAYEPIRSPADVTATEGKTNPLAFVVPYPTNKSSDKTLALIRRLHPHGTEELGDRDPGENVLFVTYYVNSPAVSAGP